MPNLLKPVSCIVLLIAMLGGCGAAGSSASANPSGKSPAITLAPELPPAESAAAPGNIIRNPVMDRDFPDPDTVKVGGTYYAYATNGNNMNIQVASSPDLIQWKLIGNALPRAPSWASKEYGYNWAPEVTRFGDGYVMYFATRLPIKAGGLQCIGLATSVQPEGPFEPTENSNQKPFICQQNEGGSIDPSTFIDDDGKRYLLWKSDANSQGGASWLYIQALTADGLSLQGRPARLITVDKRWEGLVVEAPTLWKQAGKYYLFYSANDYKSRDYAVGYAVAEKPAGPYVKGTTNPILKTNIGNGVIGPGGQDIVAGPDGKTYILFHAWTARGYRSLDLAPLEWKDGVPVVKLPPRDSNSQ